MINWETIKSLYNDKPTLLEWLKKVNTALENATFTGVSIEKTGDATLKFHFDFEDGTYLETPEIVLQQGESVTSAAIVGGNLLLTLTNGDVLNAGNTGAVSSFSIDPSQHLIVNYQNGTTQDLGAIFSGNVAIGGTLTATNAKIFEDIRDANDNKRFITFSVNAHDLTGMVTTYRKSTLSGTHMMIVHSFYTNDEVTISSYDWLDLITVPAWVYEKISPISSLTNRVIIKTETYTNQYGESQGTFRCSLQKESTPNVISVRNPDGIALTIPSGVYCRIQYDLIIDNE